MHCTEELHVKMSLFYWMFVAVYISVGRRHEAEQWLSSIMGTRRDPGDEGCSSAGGAGHTQHSPEPWEAPPAAEAARAGRCSEQSGDLLVRNECLGWKW